MSIDEDDRSGCALELASVIRRDPDRDGGVHVN